MPVVRESPRAHIPPDKNSTQWPPRSPFQALLSSPSGRKKWQSRDRVRSRSRDVSPSPVKNGTSGRVPTEGGHSGEDEDDDEETLELKLKAIETKLKLKKLQNAKKATDEGDCCTSRAETSTLGQSSPRKSSRPRSRLDLGGVGKDIEVPLSPTRDPRKDPQEQFSPARARLGLKPSLKPQDVSLKRARDGTQLPRYHAGSRALTYVKDENATNEPQTKPSFSERLAQSKVEAQERKAKDDVIERSRREGFSVQSSEPSRGHRSKRSSRSEATGSNLLEAGPGVIDGKSRPRGSQKSGNDGGSNNFNGMFRLRPPRARSRDERDTNPNDDSDSSLDVQNGPDGIRNQQNDESDSSYYDSFSETQLSKRHLPHTKVAREMFEKEIYTLPRLLKEVKAPEYDPPDCEHDFIVFAILASKSSPFDQKQQHRTSDQNKPQEDATAPRGKFMVLHLTDLKWELDLFLFGTAFDQFWKLTPGTLLAILNPGIMPPKTSTGSASNNGRFCLKLGSCEDSILEIGVARDLGWCESVRKDGKACGSWVDKRKTGVCEFHLEMAIEKDGRRGRMEVNTMWRSHEGTGMKSGGGGARRGKGSGRDKGNFHREYGQLYSVPPGLRAGIGGIGGGSAATLLDAEDKTDAMFGPEAAEASRKRIAAAQRERDLVRKLGKVGKGVGAEYLRSQRSSSAKSTAFFDSDGENASRREKLFEKPSAAELGLLGNKAGDAHLSPAKDRKRHFGLGAVSTTGSEAMDWGGARKAGLLEPQHARIGSPKRGQTTLDRDRGRNPDIVRNQSEDGSLSPTKKRARFALDKGIREPGRESLGQRNAETNLAVEDDELDIV